MAGTDISIHSFLAESDDANPIGTGNTIFQSTASSQKATLEKVREGVDREISIHSFLAESDPYRIFQFAEVAISIHSFLAESDREFF